MKATTLRLIRLLPLISLAAVASATPSESKRTPEDNYEEHCASCHGSDGKAKTRLGRKSGAKDLTDAARIAKLTDENIFKGIKFGRKNKDGEDVMDPFKDELNDQDITALVAYVRTLSKQ